MLTIYFVKNLSIIKCEAVSRVMKFEKIDKIGVSNWRFCGLL